MLHGETIQSALPQDIPWWMADHFVFFGVLYLVIFTLAAGLAYNFYKSLMQTKEDTSKH